MPKRINDRSGFTLIEVIVVAVIIAVLSAVAIPLYNGYITDSRRNTAENVAGSAASFLGTAVASRGIHPTADIEFRYEGGSRWETVVGQTISDLETSGQAGVTPAGLRVVDGSQEIASFIIPTDISIDITWSSGTVTAKHISDPTNTVTDEYHFSLGGS
jgi:prepilin-type N-terminal cleavage/methylation domain-containing protein